MQLIAPEEIDILSESEVDTSNLELNEDWATNEFKIYILELYKSLPAFLRKNFRIRITVTEYRGGGAYSESEKLIELRLPTRLIGESMQEVRFRDSDPYRQRELGKLGIPPQDLLDEDTIYASNAYARDVVNDEDYRVQSLNIFRKKLKEEGYANYLLHEYGHMLFGMIRATKEIELDDIEEYLDTVNKLPDFVSAYDTIRTESIEYAGGLVDNSYIYGLSNKIVDIYARFLSPEDFFNFLKRRYFIMLEEISLRINEIIQQNSYRDNEQTAEDAIEKLEKDIFNVTKYLVWIVPQSDKYIEMLRTKGCYKTLEKIMTHEYTMEEFIKSSLSRFPNLPDTHREFFENQTSR